jgi:hypothetical protein
MRNGLEIVQQQSGRFLSTAVPCKTVQSLFFALVGPNVPLLLILLRCAEFCGDYIPAECKEKQFCGRNTLHFTTVCSLLS